MKQKAAHHTSRKALLRKADGSFDSTEFMLLAFVTVALLLILAGQFHLFPGILPSTSVLGAFTQK